MTMTLISTTTLTGSAASITFSSIPQTYTDLQLVLSGRSSGSTASGGGYANLKPNASASSHSLRRLQGNGSAVVSDTDTLFYMRINPTDWTANTFGNASVYIPNYAGSAYKAFSFDHVNENNATEAVQAIHCGLWSSTAAITSLVIEAASGSLVTGTVASLYGILKGSGGATVS